MNKNILFSIVVMLLSLGNAFVQTNSLDNKLQKIDQTTLTSGIIYNCVLPMANIVIYNMPADKQHNTADLRFFGQAIFLLYNKEKQMIFHYFDSS